MCPMKCVNINDLWYKAILRRKPKEFKGASNDSRSVQGLTDQYVTGCAQRKLDVHEGQDHPPRRPGVPRRRTMQPLDERRPTPGRAGPLECVMVGTRDGKQGTGRDPFTEPGRLASAGLGRLEARAGALQFKRINDLACGGTAGRSVALLCFSPRVSHCRRRVSAFKVEAAG